MTRSIGHASDNTACAPFGRSDTGPHYPCKRIHQSWNRSKKTPSTELLRWDGTISVNQLLVRDQSGVLVLAKDCVGAFVRRSEERRVGKSVDLGGPRIIQ